MKLHIINFSAHYLQVEDDSDGLLGICLPGRDLVVDSTEDFAVLVISTSSAPVESFTPSMATGNVWIYDAAENLSVAGTLSTGIPATYDVPAIGTVAVPAWATTPELALFFVGVATAAGVKLVRAGLRWFKRADGVHTE